MEADRMRYHAAMVDFIIQFSKDNVKSFPNLSQQYKLDFGYDFTRFELEKVFGTTHILKDSEKREIFIIILGSISVEGLQMYIKNIPYETFSALEIFNRYKQQNPSYNFIGVGYSSGACVVAALADITKQIKGICFNPIGLGEIALRDLNSLKKFNLSPEPVEVEIYKIIGDQLSKLYISPGDLNKVFTYPSKPNLNPHSIRNFLDYPEINLSRISKYFPTLKQITFNPKTGFLLIETDKSDENSCLEGDLATIFYTAYQYPGRFSFTLMPSDPKNPQGPYQQKIYDPPELEDTSIGNALFEAD